VELEIPAEEKSKNPAEAFEVVEGLEINGPGLPHSDSETSIDRQLEHEKWNRKPCFYLKYTNVSLGKVSRGLKRSKMRISGLQSNNTEKSKLRNAVYILCLYLSVIKCA